MINTFKDYILKCCEDEKAKNLFLFSLLFPLLLLLLFPAARASVAFFLPIAAVSIIFNGIIIVYGFSQKANLLVLCGVCALNICAALSRAVFADSTDHITEAISFMCVGLIVVVLFDIVYKFMKESSGLLRFFSLLLTLGLSFLCCFLPLINNARAWIEIGGFSIQITEFVKFFFILYIGTLFSLEGHDWYKFVSGLIVAGICAGLLILRCNEFGTVIVMGCAYLWVAMISLKKKSCKALLVLLVFLAILSIFVLYNTAKSHMGHWECPDCTAINSASVTECNDCEEEKPEGLPSFLCLKCGYSSWLQKATKDNPVECRYCTEVGYFQKGLGPFAKKIYDRFCVAFDKDNVLSADLTYHARKNELSMQLGRFFGSTDITYTPMVDTDSAVAGLMNRLGLLFIILILLSFALIYYAILKTDSIIRISAICAIFFQGIITYLGTANLIPATGIGVPLISRGGSNLIISYLLIYLIISATHSSGKGVKR